MTFPLLVFSIQNNDPRSPATQEPNNRLLRKSAANAGGEKRSLRAGVKVQRDIAMAAGASTLRAQKDFRSRFRDRCVAKGIELWSRREHSGSN
ncbi:MAG: hypothetical protein ACLP19_16915 [Xanthobacteraceae bacterium]